MQNDMLKNNVAPWQENGRWYHATVKFDANAGAWKVIQNESDDTGSMIIAANFYLIFFNDKNHVILDYKIVADTSPVQTFTQFGILHADIRDAIQLPGASLTTDGTIIEVWAFIRHR